MDDFTITILFIGATVTIVGYFFPSANKVLPEVFEHFWSTVRWGDWTNIAEESVDRFVDLIEQMATFTASGARAVPVIFILLLGSLITGLELSGARLFELPFDLESVIERSIQTGSDILIATSVVLVAVFITKRTQGPVQTLSEVASIRRMRRWREFSITRWRSRMAQAESRLRELGSTPHGGDAKEELENIKNQIYQYEKMIERAELFISESEDWERKLSKGRDIEEMTNDGRGAVFRIFLLSSASLGIYLSFCFFSIAPSVSYSLFHSAPPNAFMSAVTLIFPLTVIFVLLQSFVPSFFTLWDPKQLVRLIESDSTDPLRQGGVFLFLFGAALSLLLTYGAFFVGHTFDPTAYVPQTMQMIATNALFDGLTFAATILILRFATMFSGWLSLIVLAAVIVVDIIIAASLACLSLMVGLWGTPEVVTSTEALNILFGLDRAGLQPDFGPLFWVMHTAFLPTVGYMAFIAFWTLAKLVMGLALLVSRRASAGLMPTGGMISALAVILEAGSYFYSRMTG